MNQRQYDVWVFPGQGSQSVGMGQAWIDTFPRVREYFDQADQALGMSLSSLVREGPEAELTLTHNAQPAILTLSVAIADVLTSEYGLKPKWVAGHSLGEYSALVISGALSFQDAVTLVRDRGVFMQEAVAPGEGGMSAVLGVSDHIVEKVCQEVSRVGSMVEPANYNCPGQLVISGHLDALERAEAELKAKGAKRCIRLSVSAPFHSSLLRPAGERLAERLKVISWGALQVPLVANVTSELVVSPDLVPQLLSQQVYHPVKWTQSVQLLETLGAKTWIEVGPGKALQGLVKKCVRDGVEIVTTQTPSELGSP